MDLRIKIRDDSREWLIDEEEWNSDKKEIRVIHIKEIFGTEYKAIVALINRNNTTLVN